MEMYIPKELLENLSKHDVDILSFTEAQFQKPIISIRTNKHKVFNASEIPIAQTILWCDNGYYLIDKPHFSKLPSWHAGTYYVQESSSMFLGYLWKKIICNEPKKILELCASPGGKTTLLENELADNDILVANEAIRSRINPLVENIQRWGARNTIITNNQPAHFGKLPNFFDVLIVDAPCSGSGLFRKMPEHTKKWNIEMVHHCAERQKRILYDALPTLKNNGYLFYSTCSFSIEENEMILDMLVAQGFESVDISIPKNFNIIRTLSPQHQAVGFRFYPHLLLGEGFFIACLQKKQYTPTTKHTTKPLLSLQSKNRIPAYIPYATEQEEIIAWQNQLHIVKKNILEDIRICLQYLNIQYISTPVGVYKGKDFIPAHAISMCSDKKNPDICYLLNNKESIDYIYKKSFENTATTQTTWLQATYQNNVLGWLKSNKTHLKNYYPTRFAVSS